MAWSWASDTAGNWEDHPAWRGQNPRASRGVDRAPDSSNGWWNPEASMNEAFFGGPFGGAHGFGSSGPNAFWWSPRGRGRGHHGRHGPRGHRGQQPQPDPEPATRDAADASNNGGSSRDAPNAPPQAPAQAADADPPTSTPDELNNDNSSGTAVPDEGPFTWPHPFYFGPPHAAPPHCPPRPSPGPHPRGPPHHRGGPHGGPHRGRGGRRPSPSRHNSHPGNPWASTFHNLANAIFPNAAGNTSTNARASTDEDAPFTPPLDLFATPTAYVLHVALPGAKKSDIGVDWDHDSSTLRVAGVVYRPGDEALLASLLPSSAERRVGYFERLVKLPPAEMAEQTRRWRGRQPQGTRVGEKTEGWEDDEGREDIDGAAITAKMEDGILIVTVPRIEKGWTEVTQVDIE